MTSDPPEYYTAEELARKVGRCRRGFQRHLANDVGGIRTKAREIVKGIGHRFNAAKCGKYLALARRPAKVEKGTVGKEASNG